MQKIDSSGTRNYITDGDSPAAGVLSDGLATFTPSLSERRSSTSSFYHGSCTLQSNYGAGGDVLGSTRSQTIGELPIKHLQNRNFCIAL